MANRNVSQSLFFVFETYVRAEYVHNLREDFTPKKILFKFSAPPPRKHSTFTLVLYIHGIVLKMKRAFIGGCAAGEIKSRKNIQALHFDFMGTLDFSRKVKISLQF